MQTDRLSRVLTHFLQVLAVLSAIATAACESASTSFTGPTGSKCSVAVTNNTSEVPAAGGGGNITVATSRDCAWSATTDSSWVSLSTTSGQGPATVNYSAAANPRGAPRRAGIVIAEQRIEVAQAAAECRFDVTPSSVNLDAAGRQVAIHVTALDGCGWTARPGVPWIVAAAPAAGTGTGDVQLTVSANSSNGARVGTVAIGNATVRVAQSGVNAPAPPTSPAPEPTPTPTPSPTPAPPPTSCTYHLSPSLQTVGADPREFTVQVAAPAGCSWTATSDAPWLTVADPRSGSGDGGIRIAVGGNSGAPRTGTVHVGPETLTVQQAGAACTYTIKPNSYDAGRGPDRITINVTAESWCTWTASTDADWVTIDAGSSGAGNGVVRLLIPANSGAGRTAIVTIAGNAFTLQQEPGCTPSIKPDYYDAGRGPDDIRIAVTATAGCTWTAASTVPWVTVAEGSTGSGNGTVRLLLEPNSGAARAVTLTIAGRPFALTQEGAQ